MFPPINTQLMAIFRRRSAIVSGCVLVCLVSQTLLPGLAGFLTTSQSSDSADTAGCCAVNLADVKAGCCCSSKASGGCGCACGTKQSASAPDTAREKKSARTFESEICGCGGKHRPGFVSSVEPAVLHSADLPLLLETERGQTGFSTILSGIRLAPPVPPPESIT